MKSKITVVGLVLVSLGLLAGCSNSNNAKGNEAINKSSQVKKASHRSPSAQKDASSSTSSDHSASSSTGVHLTGGQSTIDYITKIKGDKGWVIDGGTYGGAHGAPTTPDYVPYNVVRSADNSEWYFVYQDGRIVEQKEMEQDIDQANSSTGQSSAVTTDTDDEDE